MVQGRQIVPFGPTVLACLLFALSFSLASTAAADSLQDSLNGIKIKDLVPEADRLGGRVGGRPIIKALKSDTVVGYIILNTDFSNAIGYSGKPIES